MKIKWYGHSAFLITTAKGVRIIIDPYQSGAFGGDLSYGKITDEADIVLSSHDHDDHNYTKDIKGRFTYVNKKRGSGYVLSRPITTDPREASGERTCFSSSKRTTSRSPTRAISAIRSMRCR